MFIRFLSIYSSICLLLADELRNNIGIELLSSKNFSQNKVSVSVTKSRDRWKSLVQRYRTSGQFGPAFMFTAEMQFLDEFLNAVPPQP